MYQESAFLSDSIHFHIMRDNDVNKSSSERTHMELSTGIHHFPTGPFNWYVIEDAGRLTVVDAGFPGHYSILIDGLRTLNREVKDVAAIILTHSHADHTGFAERLRRESGPVYIHQDDRAAISRPLQLPWYGLLTSAWRSYIRSMLLHATWNGVFRLPCVTEAITFKDGDILDVPGKPVVLHTPGHTPGEVVFHLPERKVLFSGDTLVTQNLMTGKQSGPQLPHRLLNGNDCQSRKSLERLTELGLLTMLPGHGKHWTGSMTDAVEIARNQTTAK